MNIGGRLRTAAGSGGAASSPERGRFRRTSPLTRSRGGSSGGIGSSVLVSPGPAGEVNEPSGAVGCERPVTPGPSLQNPDYSNTNNPVWEVLAHGAHT